jgi:hypothetical protein
MSGKMQAEGETMAATNTKGPQHNHVWDYLQGYITGCPRCNYLKTLKELEGETQHNHERMPFGRQVKGCPRCIELANGAPKREGFNDHRNRLDAQHTEAIRRHFADPNSRCDHITCFDW